MAKESEISHPKNKKKNNESNEPGHKSHRSRKSGASAKKKLKSKPNSSEVLSKEQKKINNPKVSVGKSVSACACTLMNFCVYLFFD